MTRLERLQALERELADLSLRLTYLRIDEIRDDLVDAAPDLIQVALAAQWYIECLEAVLERRPVRGLDEAQHGYEAAIAPLLESESSE